MSYWVSSNVERVSDLISEIIQPFKGTIQYNQYVELQNIWTDAGKHILHEMEKLEEEGKNLIEDECVLLRRMNAKAECEKSNFQIKLEELKTHRSKTLDENEILRTRVSVLEEEITKSHRDIEELRRKQRDADQENLELKRKIAGKSKETIEAKNANTSFCYGELRNFEIGSSSTSTERASAQQEIDAVSAAEVIVSLRKAIPGAATSNSDVRPYLLLPSWQYILVPRRKRSRRAYEDGNSRLENEQAPIPSLERGVVLGLPAYIRANPESGRAKKGRGHRPAKWQFKDPSLARRYG